MNDEREGPVGVVSKGGIVYRATARRRTSRIELTPLLDVVTRGRGRRLFGLLVKMHACPCLTPLRSAPHHSIGPTLQPTNSRINYGDFRI